MKTLTLGGAISLVLLLPAVQAQEPVAEETLTPDEFITALDPQEGHISLPGGIAELNLPSTFRYLSPDSTETLLVEGWGNPPGNETLGMVIPTHINPLEQAGWGIVITYDEDGYVSDADAEEINYDELLGQMKESSQQESDQRVEAGYGKMLLAGWAEPPRYEKDSHKLYWAQEFVTDYTEENSLNYNIRVLGRQGVLVLNAVAGMNQIDRIREEMPRLLAVTEFTAGNRYEEFDASTDRVAEYGLAALVAGGVAAKMGLFTKFFALLLAFKKGIFIVGAALVAGVSRWLGRNKNTPDV
ncbi:MAG: DUF2167 domain-containing protein [Pseudomonadota bacterium]